MAPQDLRRIKRLNTPRYLPGLDGFRAVAVIAIIIFHLNNKWLPGGFLGVDTFFVISGYLITSLLLSEYYREGSINLITFWRRRIKRLIPALLFLIMIVLSYAVLFEPKIILDIKKDAVAAFLYISNWWYIHQDVDYFNQFAIEPLKHLWSLAIEEQFYLIYPIFLAFLLKKYDKRFIFFTILFVSLLSLGLMILLSASHGNNSRVYFGTDTRLQTLLLGALLSMIWPPFNLKKNPPKLLIRIIDLAGFTGASALIMLFISVSDNDIWIYKGGFYLISFLTLFIIASAVHPSGRFAKILGSSSLIYIGKRSYSLYLWHYPIIVFVHKNFVDGQIPLLVYVIDFILIILMSEVSYRLIETPVRKKGLSAFSIIPTKRGPFLRLILVLILITPTFLLFNGTFDERGKVHTESKQTSFTNKNDKKNIEEKEQRIEDSTIKAKDLSPLLIGDSVMVDIGPTFEERVPDANIDGSVGRQLAEASTLVQNKYKNYSKSKKDVVIELGTNGGFTEDQLNELISNLGDANIYLVTVRVPRDYEDSVNSIMRSSEKQNKNVHLIDWHKESEGHQDYFAYDGIHLEQKGSEALSNLIIKAILNQHKNEQN